VRRAGVEAEELLAGSPVTPTPVVALAWDWAVAVACLPADAAFLPDAEASHTNTPPPLRSSTRRTTPTMRPTRLAGRLGEGGDATL
jgi:hypothetical protein